MADHKINRGKTSSSPVPRPHPVMSDRQQHLSLRTRVRVQGCSRRAWGEGEQWLGAPPTVCGTEDRAVLSGPPCGVGPQAGHQVGMSRGQISGRAASPGGCPRWGSAEPGSVGGHPGRAPLSGLLSGLHRGWPWNFPECLRTRPCRPAQGTRCDRRRCLHPHHWWWPSTSPPLHFFLEHSTANLLPVAHTSHWNSM